MNLKKHSFLYQRGFTFVEVMYSVLIAAVTLVMLFNMSSQSNTHLKRSDRYSIVSSLMELKMMDIEILYLEEGMDALEQMTEGEFENEPNFTWTLETQKMDEYFNPLTLESGNDLTSNKPQAMEQVQIVNNKFAELITEIKLTIHYKQNNQEASYTLTTYMADFKKAHSPEFKNDLQNSLTGGALVQ